MRVDAMKQLSDSLAPPSMKKHGVCSSIQEAPPQNMPVLPGICGDICEMLRSSEIDRSAFFSCFLFFGAFITRQKNNPTASHGHIILWDLNYCEHMHASIDARSKLRVIRGGAAMKS